VTSEAGAGDAKQTAPIAKTNASEAIAKTRFIILFSSLKLFII
jgi:hypothetical protein